MERCTGIKKDGSQCMRLGAPRCFQHIENQCSICLSNMNSGNSRCLDCTHSFHKKCLERWKRTNRTCPMCRAPFDQPIYRIGINIQCIHDGTRALHTYNTSDITLLSEAFDLDSNIMTRSIADIQFDIENDDDINAIPRSLGITSFRLPDSNTVSST